MKDEPRITYMSLAELKPAARNPKEHATPDIEASIQRFGFVDPLIINEATGLLVSGHGRLEALQNMQQRGDEAPTRVRVKGRVWSVPVVRGVSFENDREAEAYLLATNHLVTKGGWSDDDMLGQMFADIAGYDEVSALFMRENRDEVSAALMGTGFDIDGMGRLVNVREHERVVTDDVPDPPATPVTREGDVWTLGRHRLVCGDATKPTVWSALMGDTLADLLVTDPPYGVDYVGGSRIKDKGSRRDTGEHVVVNDDEATARMILSGFIAHAYNASRAGAPWYVFMSSNLLGELQGLLKERGIYRQILVWVKESLVISRLDYHYRHEPFIYGWKPGAAHKRPDSRKHDSVFEFPRPKRNKLHATMKPVELIQRLVETSSSPGDVVVDPFGGSGTTLMVAESTGRVARTIELSPLYCDVIIDRWQQHTGEKASRQ